MGTENNMSPRMLEDLQPRHVGGPEKYAKNTEKPVRYVQVANEGVPYGYIWAVDEDDAAAFLLPEGAGDDASNAAVSWNLRLRKCKARGLTPTQALEELSADSGGQRIGRVVPGSQAEAPSLTALRAIAANE